MSGNSVHALLKDFKCTSPAFPNEFNKVISVREAETVVGALERMRRANISAVVVVADVAPHRPTGLLSVRDLLVYALQKADLPRRIDGVVDIAKGVSGAAQVEFGGATVKDAVAHLNGAGYRLSEPVVVDEVETLHEAVRQLLKKHAHEALVVSPEGRAANVISVSRVFRLVAALGERVAGWDTSLAELGLADKQRLVVARKELLVKDVLRGMVKHRVSSAPVVEGHGGPVVGFVSISDFKRLSGEHNWYHYLHMHVGEYTEHLRNEAIRRRGPSLQILPDVVAAYPDDTLGTVWQLMVIAGVHRLAVVAHDTKVPLRILSQSDILRHVLTEERRVSRLEKDHVVE